MIDSTSFIRTVLDSPVKVTSRSYISNKILEQFAGIRTDIFVEKLEEDILVEVRAIIQGASLEKIEASYPDGWYEAVRERFWPRFILKRFPVKYKIIKLESMAAFLQIKEVHKDSKPNLIYMKNGNPIRDYS